MESPTKSRFYWSVKISLLNITKSQKRNGQDFEVYLGNWLPFVSNEIETHESQVSNI